MAHQLWLFAIDSGPSASLIRFHPRLRTSRWLCAMDRYRKSPVFVASARIQRLCAITAQESVESVIGRAGEHAR
jgi:hypothetical protein